MMDRNILGVTVLVLRDARSIDANVSKPKVNVPAVVMVALCAETSDFPIPIRYFDDVTLNNCLTFSFIFLYNF